MSGFREGIGTNSSGARGGVAYGVQRGIESTLSCPVSLYSSSGTRCTQYTTTPFAPFESKGERRTLSVISVHNRITYFLEQERLWGISAEIPKEISREISEGIPSKPYCHRRNPQGNPPGTNLISDHTHVPGTRRGHVIYSKSTRIS